MPDDFFHDGILRFDGPLTSLRIDSSATSAGAQGFTLAIDDGAPTAVPAPGAATIMLAGIAGLAGLAWRRRRPENPLTTLS